MPFPPKKGSPPPKHPPPQVGKAKGKKPSKPMKMSQAPLGYQGKLAADTDNDGE